ncbi:MAG: PAS domain S-box protein [Prochloraceae cyanobacterium]|nr:PAS domain S-box protein [Prochloraceae cyanobacterium]
MKIWQKLILAFGLSSSLLGIISVSTIKIDKEIQSQSNEIVSGILRETKAGYEMFSSIQSIQNLTEKLLVENQSNLAKQSTLKKYQFQIERELNQLESTIREAKEATISQQKLIDSFKINMINQPVIKSEDNEDFLKLNELFKQVQLYRKEWNVLLENLKQNPKISEFDSENNLINRMNQSITPLVKKYYENSLSEIIESELTTQRLVANNIRTIRNYSLSGLLLSLLLFIYIYHSIYAQIKKLKVATFELGQNFSEYEPIQTPTSNDELGKLIDYFNKTIKQIQEKIIDKSYLDRIINSMSQSLIVIDNQNKITKINNNTQELLGYIESELVGQSIHDILAPGNILNIDELIELDNISENCFLLDLITKARQKISVRVYFSSLYDSLGQKRGTICMAIENDHAHLTEIVLRKSKENAKKNTEEKIKVKDTKSISTL